ncbi:MAG: c-type cytochrome domain-containing protein [Rhodospirillales bacterium]|jgi:hypothetical protein|nr:c-type cytochrome domain-containing protein [Rhodospirillales bacterium]MDP6883919.1 c-type cytochrome domain-containing protein [Rhodospirillales bacterium]
MHAVKPKSRSSALIVMGFLWMLGQIWPATALAKEPVSFKEDIFPIIQIRCPECHLPAGEGYKKSGLDLRSYEGLMKGTKFGPVVVPGDAFTSNLNVLIEGRASKEIQMPQHMKKLTSCDLDLFRRWVNQGAKNN